MSSEEASIFSTFLFCLLMFVFSTSEIEARKLGVQMCSSSCGDVRNISYPFRLKGDPAGCGHPELELSCENNKTILELSNSARYYVKRISHDKCTISVADVNLANGSCGLPYKSFSPYPYFFRHINGYILKSYAHYVNCSSNIVDQAYTKVPCLSNNQSNVYVYVGHVGYGVTNARISDLPDSCVFISKVPVVLNRSVDNPSYEDLRKSLESGFDLKRLDECRDNSFTEYCNFRYNEGVVAKIICYPCYMLYRVIYLAIFWPSMGNGISFLVDVPIIGRFILAPIVFLVFLIQRYRKSLKRVDNVEKFLHNQQSWMPKRYSYPQIIAMTNHFTHKLGQGGFGSVYKGQLQTGGLIAVKMLENSKFSAEEFINEVSTIGRIHHVNVVQLLGFCSEGSKRALVYEYMPNGSLDRHVFPKESRGQSLCWEKLHEVALGTARGIEYLHNGCDVCILHFDIKPHNILLDHNFIPKVSDFGLAKFHPKENDFVSISATRGTIGYIAPELISRNFGTVSCKSDVYGFGMVLLEMAGGRRNSNMNATRSSKAYFPSWVYDQLNKGGDLELQNVTEIESMIARKLCMIGLWCIQVKAADRPSMTKVLEMLEGSIDDLQMPPRPFFSSSRHISGTGREIESDSSAELLVSESMEECSFNDSYV
ncbi:LEAF RUST 10 DISEASE-RESISTANCE LOCUS RECEPTOR-LIKE PROTEIN KINASE-like 2.4 isoform X6 [Citrus sinensis]|uniref:LEAF RUST 10 DISEASE-RESISTANCE LOCUS RECEPTOR-LIKE PROTEIN KINASE-like 2.4 isoform X6 n=1 Tax=Citrus sinensis TaxID=2711 RepID=UPI0022780235|nr:LEAF RUST 10 DISEASE-RESISTANCE LOCUS RECEPTOR-LIKE PROTEIN KINASE-like 2.4 isoform X6 [Citrus sinensis]